MGKDEKIISRPAFDASVWSEIFRCYAHLLRLDYHGMEALTNERMAVYEKIHTFLERKYKMTIDEYLKDCERGNSAGVNRILKAIGPCAFDEPWFIEGMKTLQEKGKEFKIPSVKPVFDISERFKESQKLEWKLLRGQSFTEALSYWDDSESAGVKTRYYRLPDEYEPLIIHNCYGFLHPGLHAHTLEDITPYPSLEELDKWLSRIDELVPSKNT
jgi:hypothetical protein